MHFTRPKKRRADRVMADDYFKFAGTTYRITDVDTQFYSVDGRTRIRAYDIKSNNPHAVTLTLEIERHKKIKTFNQKTKK